MADDVVTIQQPKAIQREPIEPEVIIDPEPLIQPEAIQPKAIQTEPIQPDCNIRLPLQSGLRCRRKISVIQYT